LGPGGLTRSPRCRVPRYPSCQPHGAAGRASPQARPANKRLELTKPNRGLRPRLNGFAAQPPNVVLPVQSGLVGSRDASGRLSKYCSCLLRAALRARFRRHATVFSYRDQCTPGRVDRRYDGIFAVVDRRYDGIFEEGWQQ